MNNGFENSAVSRYNNVNTQTGVDGASPQRLIQMLLEGASRKIAMAKGAMQRGEITARGDHITGASTIFIALRDSLDMEAGGEISRNLDRLYGYMIRRLMEAHGRNDVTGLDEVAALLAEIRRGWEALAEQTTGAENGFRTAVSG